MLELEKSLMERGSGNVYSWRLRGKNLSVISEEGRARSYQTEFVHTLGAISDSQELAIYGADLQATLSSREVIVKGDIEGELTPEQRKFCDFITRHYDHTNPISKPLSVIAVIATFYGMMALSILFDFPLPPIGP